MKFVVYSKSLRTSRYKLRDYVVIFTMLIVIENEEKYLHSLTC